MTPDAALLRILYDPAGWAAPGWLPHFDIQLRWPRRLCNSLLIQRASLRAVTPSDLSAPCVSWLVAHWNVLEPAVYLVGARLARNALVSANALPHLHHHAYRFVSLPLSEAVWGQAGCQPGAASHWRDDVHRRVLGAGVRCLNGAWPDVPPGWSDRLRLRLPTQVQEPEVSDFLLTLPARESCLRLLDQAITFHHAQKH